MKVEEALIRLRDDLKEWVTNNLNAIGKPKASDVSITSPEGMGATDVQNAIVELNGNFGGLTFGKDGDGNCGYYGADGSLIPFSLGGDDDSICYVAPSRVGYKTPHETNLIDVNVSGYDTLFVYWESASASGAANIVYCENGTESSRAVKNKLNLIDISDVSSIQMRQKSGNKTECQANYTMAFVVFNKGVELTIDV